MVGVTLSSEMLAPSTLAIALTWGSDSLALADPSNGASTVFTWTGVVGLLAAARTISSGLGMEWRTLSVTLPRVQELSLPFREST